MDIHKAGTRSTNRASADAFTGTVWQDPIIQAAAPATLRALRVSFEPGSRTFWHTHPMGQCIHVVSGTGRVQREGGPVREIKPGDTVWFAPGEKHWHGAAPDSAMVHIAMLEALDGVHVEWLEPVSDEDYNRSPEA